MATTQWSQVLAARDGSETETRRALEGLCTSYWEPLYAFVRHQGYSPDEAGDVTQGYFTELLEKDVLDAVDPSKGRFRSFLLSSLEHFLSHERDRTRAQKRGGGARTLSLDIEGAEARFGVPPAAEMTPEEAYEYHWAVTMLNRAFVRLRRESAGSGKEADFELLRPYLSGLEEQVPYRQTARELGTSEGAVKMAVSRLRQRFGRCLRAEVAETVADPADVDDEVRHLVATLRS